MAPRFLPAGLPSAMPRLSVLAVIVCALASAPAVALTAEDPHAGVEFFEKQIRPTLVQHCVECHGPKKQEAGLRLDTAAGFKKGSDEGPIAIAGEPEQGKLLKALRQDGDLKMPPKEKLPAEKIDAFAAWIKLGLPWPAEKELPPAMTLEEQAKTHWAFQPIVKPSVPSVQTAAWPANDVDKFILAKLESQQLTPAPPADRRAWLRRVSFDLIGLPPSPAEMADFLADQTPDAYAKVVDRLLASPHFGERWGRYWLDVARYADTKGYVFQEDRRYPYAYVYRDWVVQAFNHDLPYDRFLLQQLAADQFPHDNNKTEWAALGFLTLGRRFLNNKPDIMDDRIDVIGRGLLGLTLGCCRCHDHKFDPLSMKDYYALYGVLSPAQEKQIPIAPPSEAYTNELQTREKAANDYVATKRQELLTQFRNTAEQYLIATVAPEKMKDKAGESITVANDVRTVIVARWRKTLDEAKKKPAHSLAPWLAFVVLKPEEFATQSTALTRKWGTDEKLNERVRALFLGEPPPSIDAVAQKYGQLFQTIEADWQTLLKQAAENKQPAPTSFPDAPREELRQLLYAADAPPNAPAADFDKLFDKVTRDKLRELRKKVTDWQAGPQAPVQALVLEDGATGGKPRVFLRGNANNPGPEVDRQFIAVVAGPNRRPFTKGSGRLEFAQAIIAPDNPLTARVWANRVWAHLFGAGLVRTPSDFGLRTDRPSHPELLDYLARQLLDEGFSTKRLIRTLVLSRTYQQAATRATADPLIARASQLDPENHWLWHMNRRRLDLEGLRDGLLCVSGKLDLRVGGPAEEITTDKYSPRRTIYGSIDRQNLPGLFRTFDFAGPDTHTPQRFVTTVPQQALFLMNSPFAIEQAQALSARSEVQNLTDPNERIQKLYELTLGRSATPAELDLGRRFVESAASPGGNPAQEKLSPWARYAHILLLSNEFAFVD